MPECCSPRVKRTAVQICTDSTRRRVLEPVVVPVRNFDGLGKRWAGASGCWSNLDRPTVGTRLDIGQIDGEKLGFLPAETGCANGSFGPFVAFPAAFPSWTSPGLTLQHGLT